MGGNRLSGNKRIIWILIPLVLLLGVGYWIYPRNSSDNQRTQRVIAWIKNPVKHPEWLTRAGQRCGKAPFQLPTDGYIGFLWDDTFQIGHSHQGIDIFSGTDGNITPVYAVYPGFLSRMPDWKSSLIVRIPSDPLQPGRQIWIYYTHLAGPSGESYIEENFPPGAEDIPVQAGELLGYQGNYSGQSGSPTGVHLHLSVVLDDGKGRWLNELRIENTLDPSPYFGLTLNANDNPLPVPICEDQQ
jgi:peptidoglycan LD-endopeptidase LytH